MKDSFYPTNITQAKFRGEPAGRDDVLFKALRQERIA
jgi:hypothetical protein